MRWLDSITDSMNMNLIKLQEIVKDGEVQFMGSQRVRHDLATEHHYYLCITMSQNLREGMAMLGKISCLPQFVGRPRFALTLDLHCCFF